MISPLWPGLGAGVISAFTSWCITAHLFHPWQRKTPATWRATTLTALVVRR